MQELPIMKSELVLDVLIVDDDRNICRTLAMSLKDLDCRATQVHSVKEALEKMQGHAYDLVLTDFRMEQQTGLDLIRESNHLGKSIIIVVMTAFASFEN